MSKKNNEIISSEELENIAGGMANPFADPKKLEEYLANKNTGTKKPFVYFNNIPTNSTGIRPDIANK